MGEQRAGGGQLSFGQDMRVSIIEAVVSDDGGYVDMRDGPEHSCSARLRTNDLPIPGGAVKDHVQSLDRGWHLWCVPKPPAPLPLKLKTKLFNV